MAADFLKKKGAKILAKNKTYKVGELDIIAEDDQSLIFVEVKYRNNNSYGTASEMVNQTKQAKLQKAALFWLQENDPKMKKPCRFDVIAISDKANHLESENMGASRSHEHIEWIKNAF